MQKLIPIIILLMLPFSRSFAQFTIDLSKGHSLHIQHAIEFNDGVKIEIALPSLAAKEYTDKIVAFTGLPIKFKLVQSTDIPTAMAHFDGKNHYLIYNEDFFSRIKASGYSDWPAIFVLVHEIGHLLIQHPSVEDTKKRKDQELEADQFAGYGLCRLGATVQEALSYIDHFSNEEQGNHPDRNKRIKAITDGWNMGNLDAESVNGPCNSNDGNITFVNESASRLKLKISYKLKGQSKYNELILSIGSAETIMLDRLNDFTYTYKAYAPYTSMGRTYSMWDNSPKFAGTFNVIPCKTQVFTLN